MKDVKWVINRLKAMKPQEMLWRIKQKKLQKRERSELYSLHKPVIEIPLSYELINLHLDIEKLSINWSNNDWAEFSSLDLFGVYNYEDYKDKWNAGFQTGNSWPEEPFSPTINISQRVDIGDIRTNWELNRHFQFTALAKTYYCTREEKYLSELRELFYNWNDHNLFLHGVEWTSAMELAIRVNSWTYALAFLKNSECEEKLLNDIEHGILVMADYILKHRARYSSANNHLIVEMYAVALVGIITGYSAWYDEAIKILTEELVRQNYSDGVNKEMSLHYQSFIMEAYGLLWLLMTKNKISIPEVWKTYLKAMTEFIADSTDDFGTTMEFGDSDEGKILDLNGKIENHYHYVMNLMGCLLNQKYTDTPWHENLRWIVPEALKTEKEKYVPGLVCSRKKGGYTFLRSKDRRVLIGIDHGDLGYGSIAAHGHPDALSFQMFIDGTPALVDSGTYNYHITPEERDYFRSTAAHNTVMINGQEQSEMLGPFMWGEKANADLERVKENNNRIIIRTICLESNGTHARRYEYDQEKVLEIYDDIGMNEGKLFLHISSECMVKHDNNSAKICIAGKEINVTGNGNACITEINYYSKRYNQKESANTLIFSFKGMNRITIQWKG